MRYSRVLLLILLALALLSWGCGGYIPDTDQDDILDNVDQCVYHAEDQDGYKDHDGCPDRDNDEDGILDAEDKCPLTPEDKNQLEDRDGCPEGAAVDADGDGLPNSSDKCPHLAEDLDDYQDEDGCPELDNDEDGIHDEYDSCPNDMEDMDGFQDEDGCSDPDNDSDRIPDVDDECPNDPGNCLCQGYLDGCPRQGCHCKSSGHPSDQIKIMEKIYFDSGEFELKEIDRDILDAVAATINRNPQIDRILIVGNADSEEGSPMAKMFLSKKRARSVKRYLQSKKVTKARLDILAISDACPSGTGTKEVDKEKNRRVWSVVLCTNGEPSYYNVACDEAYDRGLVPREFGKKGDEQYAD